MTKCHPYRIQYHQLVTHNDANRRLESCIWVLEECNEDSNFWNYVKFTDDFSFHNTKLVNRRNFHFYDTVNPQFTRSIDHQYRWSVNARSGIMVKYENWPAKSTDSTSPTFLWALINEPTEYSLSGIYSEVYFVYFIYIHYIGKFL